MNSVNSETHQHSDSSTSLQAAMNQPRHLSAILIFLLILFSGLGYLFYQLYGDIVQVGGLDTRTVILLVVALLIALGFEFVNGFHDTANAVATVIYTHSLPPTFAVVWSGMFNFLGVLVSSGVVAYGIIALLPVELILNVGSGHGFAMVFALLLAAIIWNLGTWYFGLPASSSHTLVGSIMGVGIANAMLHGRPAITGVDWMQVQKVGMALLISPLVGFGLAAVLLLLAKRALARQPELFDAPQNDAPPPTWIRSLLILTCTGVSFAHGSNDGQKGMGLIMLILVGILPVAYGVNHSITPQQMTQFASESHRIVQMIQQHSPNTFSGSLKDVQQQLIDYIQSHQQTEKLLPALAVHIQDVEQKITQQPDLSQLNNQQVSELRNQIYLTAETIKQLDRQAALTTQPQLADALKSYQQQIDKQTKFIPLWVKIVVALALGLGTMVGWKRIVVTVGEKIGQQHLTYAQGASAELIAMGTIGAADIWGLPVSTTHVLSSGIAGTMAANRSGVQKQTLINLLLAWVSTLPAAMLLSGVLYWILSFIF